VGEEVAPVYAQGFYVVSPGVVNMVIIFDYMDRGQHYAKLLRRGGEELEREVSPRGPRSSSGFSEGRWRRLSPTYSGW